MIIPSTVNLPQSDPTLLVAHSQKIGLGRDGYGRNPAKRGVGSRPVAVDGAGWQMDCVKSAYNKHVTSNNKQQG